MSDDEKGQALADLFDGQYQRMTGRGRYEIDVTRARDERKVVNLGKLLKAAAILEASPEELMFSSDSTASSGCPTCGPELEVTLEFWKEAAK